MGTIVLSIRDFDSAPEAVRWIQLSDSEPPRLCIPSIDFEAGKCYAVVGKSGAGKTVLNSLLLGLPSFRVGRAVRVEAMKWWSGVDTIRLHVSDFRTSTRLLVRWREVRRRGALLYLPQVLPDGRGYQMSTKHYLEQVITALIRQTDIEPRAIHDPFESFPVELRHVLVNSVTSLSGGERRRVELWARLIVLRALPKDRFGVLILDEPTTGLDIPDERRYLVNLRRKIKELPNLAVIVTTHALYFLDDHLPDQPLLPLFDKICLVHKDSCQKDGGGWGSNPICRVTSAIDSRILCKSVMRRTPEKSVEDNMEAFVDWQADLHGDEFVEKVAKAYFMEKTK